MRPVSSSEKAILLNVVSKVGTPTYAYLSERINTRFDQLRRALPEKIEILYSLKANPLPEVVSFLKGLGSGADVASLRESSLALEAGFSASQVSLIGPGKSDAELRFAVSNGFMIVVESIEEALRLNAIASQLGRSIDILVRVNLESWIGSSGTEFHRIPSQFGVDENQVQEFLLRLADARHLNFMGLHCFTQSQFLKLDFMLANFRRAFALAEQISRTSAFRVQTLNLGGGFGISYFQDQDELQFKGLKEALDELVSDHEAKIGPLRILVESGRFLVGDSGFYLTRIIDKKISYGKVYLIVDGGVNHHLAATGIGQPVRRNFYMMLLNGSNAMPSEQVTISGPSCYSLDILARDIWFPKAAVGDVLCVFNSGAYGVTFSPINFLSRPPPNEVFI